MFCSQCGQQNSDDSLYCHQCGKPLNGVSLKQSKKKIISSKINGSDSSSQLTGATARVRIRTEPFFMDSFCKYQIYCDSELIKSDIVGGESVVLDLNPGLHVFKFVIRGFGIFKTTSDIITLNIAGNGDIEDIKLEFVTFTNVLNVETSSKPVNVSKNYLPWIIFILLFLIWISVKLGIKSH